MLVIFGLMLPLLPLLAVYIYFSMILYNPRLFYHCSYSSSVNIGEKESRPYREEP